MRASVTRRGATTPGKIRQTGSLLNKATRSRARPVRSQNLNISRTSLRRILNKDLGKWQCITFPIKP
ncbi:hypothetical protein ALC53_07351 [Atta colombica]|uniref:Uncharacterized protein n=1 Tax=Atta colombica TaxID=520822 RepID=A0A195BC27_9HYME|nr:hypothetical protein ALC53_07351 [Atta colombica]